MVSSVSPRPQDKKSEFLPYKIKKSIDKQNKVCYNKYIIKQRKEVDENVIRIIKTTEHDVK